MYLLHSIFGADAEINTSLVGTSCSCSNVRNLLSIKCTNTRTNIEVGWRRGCTCNLRVFKLIKLVPFLSFRISMINDSSNDGLFAGAITFVGFRFGSKIRFSVQLSRTGINFSCFRGRPTTVFTRVTN